MICLSAIHHLVYFTNFKLRKGVINFVEIVEKPPFLNNNFQGGEKCQNLPFNLPNFSCFSWF